jgi:AcrR family transcriptional regulator
VVTVSGVNSIRSARKAKGDGHLRRAEILEVAERIFVAEGYEGATIRKIADAVGVSSTALYMHFPDKRGILMEICGQTIKVLLERNREIAARPVDAAAKVRLMLEGYIRWGFEHPNAYHLVFSSAGPSAVWDEDKSDLGHVCFDIFAHVVGELAVEGRMPIGASESVAQVMWSACHGVVSLHLTRPRVDWAPEDELIGLTVQGLLQGLFAAA